MFDHILVPIPRRVGLGSVGDPICSLLVVAKPACVRETALRKRKPTCAPFGIGFVSP
jgi:hypothetical protein